MSSQGPPDRSPARTGETRCETLGGESWRSSFWPIGPAIVSTRNVFLVLKERADGVLTVHILGNPTVKRPDPTATS